MTATHDKQASYVLLYGFVAICVFVIGWILISDFVAWYRTAYATYTYRYRMTVNVSVDKEIRSGSSVIEVRLSKQPTWGFPEAIPVGTKVSGEAVFVDLGNGRNLIALLAAGPQGLDIDFPGKIAPSHFRLTYSDQDLTTYPSLKGSWELSPSQLPTFITFSDLGNPGTARTVQLEEFADVFGIGTKLQSVTIEITDDAVTRQLQDKLPWWTAPNRPASIARRAWLAGQTAGPATEPERLFIRN